MSSCLRRVYDCRNSNIASSRSQHYHLEAAPRMSRCARITNGLGWVLSRPFAWADALYNTVQLAKKKELSEPILQAAYQKCPITPFPFLGMTLYIAHQGMGAFLKTPRNDDSTGGLFVDKVNHEVFLPILSDIVEACDQGVNDGGEKVEKRKVTRDDFLLTCFPAQALRYRKVILDVMGAQHQKSIRAALEDLVGWISRAIPKGGYVEDADGFCGEFTTAAISRLFLNHPGPRETYQEIHWAIARIDKLAMQKRLGQLSLEAEDEYQRAIKIISRAIRIAESDETPGSFVELMRSDGFTDIQMRGMLFLVYLAGSGTTTTAMKYLLWQLGRHSEHQITIRNADNPQKKKELISKAISEALRLAPPVGIMGRFAARDLTFTITEKEKTLYSYRIPKGSGVLVAPLVASKRQDQREDFDPEQVKNGDALSWLPFSAGFHGCPGKSLALAELSIFVSHILRDFTITSYPVQRDLKRHQFMSLYLEKVSLQFTLNRSEQKRDD